MTALTSRRRSNQSPSRSASQHYGRLPDTGSEDSKLDQVPASCNDGETTLASSECQSRTNSLFGTTRESHHSSTDSRPDLSPSHEYQDLFSLQFGSDGVKSQALVELVHNGSAPVSPMSRLTPNSTDAEQNDQADEEEGEEEEEEEAMLTAESEESAGACQRPLTAAERKAEKRKAKRFRSVPQSPNTTVVLVLIDKD